MGWLEPLDRKLYDKPHKCSPPHDNGVDEFQPGARWQCDECQAVWVWQWMRFHGHFAWVSPAIDTPGCWRYESGRPQGYEAIDHLHATLEEKG